LFAFCVGMGLWLLVLYLRNSQLWLLAIAGLLLGYSALARPIGLVLPLFLLPSLIRSAGPNFGRWVRDAALLALGVVVVLTPWVLRNYQVHHHMVLIATNGGSTFYGANNDITLNDKHERGQWVPTNFLPHRKEIDATPDEYSHDKLEWKLGEAWVADHVVDLPLTTVYKIVRFWLPDWGSANKKFVLMQLAGYTPFGILMLLGLFVSLRPLQKALTPAWLAIHGVLAANLFATVVFYGSARFRDSIAPVLIIYATVGLDWIITRFTKRRVGAVTVR